MKTHIHQPGEVRKFLVSPKIIDDPMVKDGLEGVGLLNKTQPYYVVGGIATQSYLPSSCRRETSDIDLCLVRPLTYHSFKEMVEPIAEYLQDKGYEIETRKGSRSFGLNYKGQDGNSLTIEAPKRNKNNIDRHKKRLEREYENARSKFLEERDSTYRVTAPEDIAVPKLVRSINSLDRAPYLAGFLPKGIEKLSDEEIAKRLEKINHLREEAMHNPGDPRLADRLRFTSDLFDIRVLSELVGFNKNYWRLAEKDWNVLNENSKLRERLMSLTVPQFNNGYVKEQDIDPQQFFDLQ